MKYFTHIFIVFYITVLSLKTSLGFYPGNMNKKGRNACKRQAKVAMKKDDSEGLINAIPDCNRRLSECNDIIMRNMASTEIDIPLLKQGIKDL